MQTTSRKNFHKDNKTNPNKCGLTKEAISEKQLIKTGFGEQ
jgi:hypothetical protein